MDSRTSGTSPLWTEKGADALSPHGPTPPKASNEFSTLIGRLRDRAAAGLMVTHDLVRAKETGTRVGIMRCGRLATEMSTDETGYKDRATDADPLRPRSVHLRALDPENATG